MPTDLPPDYKPKPAKDPAQPDDPNAPGAVPTPQGQDSLDGGGSAPDPGDDVVDPSGWREPPVLPGSVPVGVPTPAGTPTF